MKHLQIIFAAFLFAASTNSFCMEKKIPLDGQNMDTEQSLSGGGVLRITFNNHNNVQALHGPTQTVVVGNQQQGQQLREINNKVNADPLADQLEAMDIS